MGRRANAAQPADLVKIFRGNLCHLDPADSSLSLEFFCSKHEVFLKELLEITVRPTATLLREAAGLVWPSQATLEQKAFCNHVHEVVKTLFTKSRNMTTGQRLPDSASRMCTHVKGPVSKNNDKFSSPGKESAAAEVSPACKAVVKRKASKLEPTACPLHQEIAESHFIEQ